LTGHIGGVVPGNDARAHRGVHLRQGRPAFAKLRRGKSSARGAV